MNGEIESLEPIVKTDGWFTSIANFVREFLSTKPKEPPKTAATELDLSAYNQWKKSPVQELSETNGIKGPDHTDYSNY